MPKVLNNLWFILLSFALWTCTDTPYMQGKRLYKTHCANCHGQHGEGFLKLYPPLAQADYLSRPTTNMACIIRYGLRDSIRVNEQWYTMEMLGIEDLNAIEITNIVNYIHHAWGNALPAVTVNQVERALDSCQVRLSTE